jgi:hypothetical protein
VAALLLLALLLTPAKAAELSDEAIVKLAIVSLIENREPQFPGVPAKRVEKAFSQAFLSKGSLDPVWWDRFEELVYEESKTHRWIRLGDAPGPHRGFYFEVMQEYTTRGNKHLQLWKGYYLSPGPKPIVAAL